MSTTKQTADRPGRPDTATQISGAEPDATSNFKDGQLSTKIGELEAYVFFENEQFSTKIGEIVAHFLFKNESFSTRSADIFGISRTSGAPDFSSDRPFLTQK